MLIHQELNDRLLVHNSIQDNVRLAEIITFLQLNIDDVLFQGQDVSSQPLNEEEHLLNVALLLSENELIGFDKQWLEQRTQPINKLCRFELQEKSNRFKTIAIERQIMFD